MSDKVIINGNEYSYGEIVKSEFFDDKSKEIVLNGEVVKVGDVWLTRELKEVLITNINIGRWPIKDNKGRTYSVYGIFDNEYKISAKDLMTKYVKDTEDVKNTEEPVSYADNGIENLPILDIQIGDVWETKDGNRVEIAHHNTVGVFEWISSEGVSYTNKGTYFSNMTSPTKDLVTRVIRATELKEATEIDEAPVLDMPSDYADALSYAIYVKEPVNDTEDVKEPINNTEDVETVEDAEEFGIKPKNEIDDLPILDIQIGDIWGTKDGKRVEIAHHNPTQEFEWISTEGDIYTNKGTYFLNMTSPSKDLVTRVIRVNKANEATEIKGTYSSDMPSSIPDENTHYADALRYSTSIVKNTDINFENAVKMRLDSLVSLIGDRICEKAKSRDVSTVKYLTKVLEKVIALESM